MKIEEYNAYVKPRLHYKMKEYTPTQLHEEFHKQIKVSKNCTSYNFDIIIDENRDTKSFLAITKNTITKLMDTGYEIMKQHLKYSNIKST